MPVDCGETIWKGLGHERLRTYQDFCRLPGRRGLKQPAIARIESHRSVPRVDTLLKLLVPLGYTLKIVPLEGSERL